MLAVPSVAAALVGSGTAGCFLDPRGHALLHRAALRPHMFLEFVAELVGQGLDGHGRRIAEGADGAASDIRADLQDELKSIFRKLNKTVLLVTHDLGEAAYLGDTIVLMRRGAIVQRGTLADLLGRPADPFVTRFINAQRSHLDQPDEDR